MGQGDHRGRDHAGLMPAAIKRAGCGCIRIEFGDATDFLAVFTALAQARIFGFGRLPFLPLDRQRRVRSSSQIVGPVPEATTGSSKKRQVPPKRDLFFRRGPGQRRQPDSPQRGTGRAYWACCIPASSQPLAPSRGLVRCQISSTGSALAPSSRIVPVRRTLTT